MDAGRRTQEPSEEEDLSTLPLPDGLNFSDLPQSPVPTTHRPHWWAEAWPHVVGMYL